MYEIELIIIFIIQLIISFLVLEGKIFRIIDWLNKHKKMRKLKSDNNGSVVPVILFILAVFGAGALYTLFMTEFALPSLSYLIPESDSKAYVFMVIYALPLIILVTGVFALLKEGLKRSIYG